MWLVAGPTNLRVQLVVGVAIGCMIVTLGWWVDHGRGVRARSLLAVAALGVATVATLAAFDDRYAVIAGMVVLLLVGFGAPVAIISGLRRRQRLDLDLLLGAVSVYLLVGIAFAMAYALTAEVQSSDLLSIQGTPSDATLRDQVYFSYVTLATTGYGDLAPLSGTARALAIVEALGGQLYLVIAMTSVVSALLQRRAA